MINFKEFLDNVTLKGLADIQKNVANETQKFCELVAVNGKPLDKLKEKKAVH